MPSRGGRSGLKYCRMDSTVKENLEQGLLSWVELGWACGGSTDSR
jgi:hypothetical protein